MATDKLPRNAAGGIDPADLVAASLGNNPEQAIRNGDELRAWQQGLPAKSVTHSSGSSTNTTTTTKSGPYDGGVLVQDAENQIAASKRFADELQAAIAGTAQQSATTASAVEATGAAQGRATKAAGEVQAVQADARIANRNLMHAATGDPSSDVVRYAAQRHDAYGALDKMSTEIAAAESVGIMDDPLAYLVNLVKVPAMKRAYNAVAMKVNTASAIIDTLQSQTAQQSNIDNGLDSTVLRAEAAAKAEAEASSAAAKASDLRTQSILQQTTLAEMVMKQSGVPLDVRAKVMRTLSESIATSNMERQGTAATKQENAEADKLRAVNIRRLQWGLPEMDMLEFKGMDPKNRDMVVRNAMVSGFANSPGEFYRMLATTGGFNTIDQAQPESAKFLRARQTSSNAKQAAEELRNPLNGGAKFATLPIDEQNEKILDLAMQKDLAEIRGDKRNYSKLDSTSPYALKKIAAARLPELQNNWVAKHIADKVVKDPALLRMENPIKDADLLDELAGRVMAAQANGNSKDAERQIREFTHFFRTSQVAQWKTSGAMMLGYPKPTEYVMAHNDYSAAAGQGLQVWNDSDVMHAIISRLREMNATTAAFQAGFGFVAPKDTYAVPQEMK